MINKNEAIKNNIKVIDNSIKNKFSANDYRRQSGFKSYIFTFGLG